MFKCECGRQFHTDEPDTDDATTCECGKVAREARSQNETRKSSSDRCVKWIGGQRCDNYTMQGSRYCAVHGKGAIDREARV